MMRCVIIVSVVLFSGVAFGQNKTFKSFIPAGYDTLAEGVVKGDLNSDGFEDVVMALGGKWELEEGWQEKLLQDSTLPKRMLLILFGSSNGYTVIAESNNAIMCKDCGGVLGDPFAGLEIKKNVVNIYHYGGSAWRWSYTHKFRYQNNQFWLIGKTRYSYWNVEDCEKLGEFAGTDFEDINFITGQYEKKKISEDCKLLENKKGKRKVEPLISLAKFEIDN